MNFLPTRRVHGIHNYPEDKSNLVNDRVRALYGQTGDRTRFVSWSKLSEESLHSLDLHAGDELLFAGGSDRGIGGDPNRALREEVFRLINDFDTRVAALGICFGAQALARAKGAEILKMRSKRIGEQQVNVKHPIGTIAAGEVFSAYESHIWTLDSTTMEGEFTVVAKSVDGPEAYVHNDLPIAGTQFHPEIDGAKHAEAEEFFLALREQALKNQTR